MNELLDNSREALSTWAEGLTERGLDSPSSRRCAEIARAGAGAWEPSGHVEQVWRATIDHLLRQTKLGVQPAAAVALLPAGLITAPAGTEKSVIDSAPAADPAPEPEPVPEPAAPEPPADPRKTMTDALISWRSEQVAAGVPGADALRDITLRNLVKFNRTSAEEIRSVLVGPAAALADELAAVIARVSGTAAATAPTPAPATVASPAAAPTAARHRQEPAAEAPQPAPVAPPEPSPAAPAPTPMASPRTAQASQPTAPPLTLTHADFCEYSFGDDDGVARQAMSLKQVTETVTIQWEPMPVDPGQVAVYRLVSGEDGSPYKPEAGDLLSVGHGTDFLDSRFLTTSYRVYQVWCHVGADAVSARANQPVLWAEGAAVSAVEDFEIFEEDGRVIGRWNVRPGTRSVRVMRRSLDGGPGGSQQIAAGQDNLAGFVDQDVPRGRRFLYRAEAEVSVGDSVRLAPAAQQEVLVSVSLVPVLDLHATATDGASFDITWSTPEAGQQVDVYRFATAPPAGLESEDREASAIAMQGFTEAEKIKDPIRLLDATRSQITGVRWPADWNRAYLTPVTSFNGRVRIGRTEILTRPIPAVTAPRIVERFHTQLITFGWPDGAAGVQVFVGMDTVPSEQICQGAPFAEVTQAQYRRDGAIVLPRPLTSEGCKVCVVPVAYSHAEQLRGEISDIAYRGLRRIHYQLRALPTPQPPGAPPGPPSPIVAVGLQTDVNIPQPPILVAVFNVERLPLDPQDGQSLHFRAGGGEQRPFAELPALQPSHSAVGTQYTIDTSGLVGFLRLFVNESGAVDDSGPRYALVDPPMHQLYYAPKRPQGPVQHG